MLQWWSSVVASVRKAIGAVVASGPIPQHVAFVLDGNRRYADLRRLDWAKGHHHGYSKVL